MASLAWVALAAAGLLEVAWASTMKASNGMRDVPLAIATVLLMVLSFLLLAYAMRSLPLGTSYAIWTGIGAVGAAIVGIVFLGESKSAWRLASIGLVVPGIAGLRVTA